MSRKSRRQRAPQPPRAPVPAAPASAPAPAPRSRKAIYVAAVTALLLAFVAGALVYTSGEPAPPRSTQSAITALASAGAPSLGPADAPVHIVEFLDPACETCAIFYPYVKQMMATTPGRIRLSVRHVAFHKGAGEAVRILEAARAQGRYWPALEALLSNQDRWVVGHRVLPEAIWPALARSGLDLERARRDMDAPEVIARMERDLADARALQVTKTPEYFVNGRQMPAFGLEQLHNLVGDELRRTAELATVR